MSEYPERPIGGKRPPRPGVRRNKPSTNHGGGKRRWWLSDCSRIEGGRDVSPRVIVSFDQQPMVKEARLKKQRDLWPTKGKKYG